MNNHSISWVDDYTVKFNSGHEIWIQNKYYAYGSLRRFEGKTVRPKALPKHKTMKRLNKMVEEYSHRERIEEMKNRISKQNRDNVVYLKERKK